jgi:hypothetical protein
MKIHENEIANNQGRKSRAKGELLMNLDAAKNWLKRLLP